VGVNEYGVGDIDGVPVSVGVSVTDVSNAGVSVADVGNVVVSVGGRSNVGVSVAGRGTCVPGKLHEDNSRHSTANFEMKSNLDLISNLLN
jgi:hypothetical protein